MGQAGGGGRSRSYDPEYVFAVTDEQREESPSDRAPHAVAVVFQPIVVMATGELVGYEALVRFQGKPGLPPSWWSDRRTASGGGRAGGRGGGAASRPPVVPRTPSSRST